MKRITAVLICGMALIATARTWAQQASITQGELVRRTQELVDSVAGGNQAPWKKYFAEDCLYFDETGHDMDKATLVKGITPLPPGHSGNIKVIHVQSRIFPDTAILSYDMEETEMVYGQEEKARYHQTDTWMRRGADWQIVASQVLRYYEDPARGRPEPQKYPDYVGTYQAAPNVLMAVSADGPNLYLQRGDRPKRLLIPESPDMFFLKGVEGRHLFRRGEDGKVNALIDRRNNEDVVWTKIK